MNEKGKTYLRSLIGISFTASVPFFHKSVNCSQDSTSKGFSAPRLILLTKSTGLGVSAVPRRPRSVSMDSFARDSFPLKKRRNFD